MQYTLILAAAALAQAREHAHGRFHKRAVVTDVDIVYVTAVTTVTADGDWDHSGSWGHHTWESSESSSPSSSALSSAEPSSTESSSAAVYTTSTSSEAESTTYSSASSEAAPVAYSSSTLATSYSSSVASSYASSSVASSSSAAAASSTGISSSNLSPNGRKAGLSGYVGIQGMDAFSELAPYISWYSDYTAVTPDSQGVMGVGMLWAADGSACGSDEVDRLDQFNSMIDNGTVPEIMFGFYEPDCDCPMSSDMSTDSAASDWTSLIAPLADKGTILGSPSMCKQFDEDFLTPFKAAITTDWDVTSIHINKPNKTEAVKDVEYYYSTYGKPIWVSEFACVHDEPDWEPCTDQDEVNTFINDVVSYFESNENIVAYGPSNGEGLGDVWPLTDSSGALTTSGKTYLAAIQGL